MGKGVAESAPSLQGPDGTGGGVLPVGSASPGCSCSSVGGVGSASGPSDHGRRQISPAPGRGIPPKGGSQTGRQKPSRGLSRQSSITAEVAPGNSPRPSILRSAEIMASGFLVSSTEPASARYSRERDSASLTSCDNSPGDDDQRHRDHDDDDRAPPPPPFLSLLTAAMMTRRTTKTTTTIRRHHAPAAHSRNW